MACGFGSLQQGGWFHSGGQLHCFVSLQNLISLLVAECGVAEGVRLLDMLRAAPGDPAGLLDLLMLLQATPALMSESSKSLWLYTQIRAAAPISLTSAATASQQAILHL